MARTKVPVTTRALTQRINRVLDDDGKRLKAARGAHDQAEFGDYCIIDSWRGYVFEKNVNLETLGRKLGVLADYEEVRDD